MAESKNWRARDADAAQAGATGAAASQRGTRGPQKAASSTHGAKGPKIPSDLPRAALLMLLDVKAAKAATELFKKHQLKGHEALALVHLPLPLPTERQALLKKCCDLIPDDVFAQCQNKVPRAGKGINPNMMQVLLDKADALNEAHQKFSDEFGLGLALLSTVEGPSPNYGYPNCDVVGSIGFGKIDGREPAQEAAKREACEEACLSLQDRDKLFNVCFETTSSKTFKVATKKCQGLLERSVHVYAWTPKALSQVSYNDIKKKLELSSAPLAAALPRKHKTSSTHDSEDKDAPSAAKDVSEITERLQKIL